MGRARCHTFGIGSGASRDLVRRTAIAGQGSFQFVDDYETEGLNAKVIASLAAACKPALAELEAHFPIPPMLQGPPTLPVVFHDQPFVMTAILPAEIITKGGRLAIEGVETQSGKKIKFELGLGDT